MIDRQCRRCLWYDNQHESVKSIPIELNKRDPGFCRKHKPGSLRIGQHFYGVWPVVDADEFCGEWREDKEG